MVLNIFSIYDSKACTHGQPFYSQTRETAVREILAALQDPNATLSKYPEDFTLFHIGLYDDEKGEVVPLAQNFNVGLISTFKVRLGS